MIAKRKTRIEAHQNGMAAIREGAYSKAIEFLSEGLENFGPHVGLLADLAGAAYLKGDMGAFQIFVERLESEFRTARDLLSQESCLRTLIALAKFYEELGRVHEAFEVIHAALVVMPPGHVLSFSVRCQKLRLMVTFAQEKETGILYRQCLQISEEKPDVWIECFHALLLTEIRLFGFDATWPRLNALFEQSEKMQAADARLLLFDAMEIALEKRDLLSRDLLLERIKFLNLSDLDPYESALLKLACDKSAISNEDMFKWTRGLSPLAWLRVVALEIARDQNPARQKTLREQMHFHLHSFDSSTRRLLAIKWGHLLNDADVTELILDMKNKTCIKQGIKVSLQNSPRSWTLLKTLAENQSLAGNDLLEILSETFSSSQELESLRIGLLRLDRKLSKDLYLGWVVRYSKDELKLNPHLRFRMID